MKLLIEPFSFSFSFFPSERDRQKYQSLQLELLSLLHLQKAITIYSSYLTPAILSSSIYPSILL